MKKHSIILCVVIIFLINACENIFIPYEENQHTEDFQAAWNRINEVYPFFELKQINWDSLYTIYSEKTLKANGDEFYTVLNDLLAELKDGHVYYCTIGGYSVYPYHTSRQIKDQDSYSQFVVRKYFDKELILTPSRSFEYQILHDSIGYIYIANLNKREVKYEFPNVLNDLKNTKSLIIDIRTNQGGSLQNVETIVSRFISDPIPWPQLYFLGKPGLLGSIEPSGLFTYSQPVVLLINGCTFSAGESTTEILKQLPNITAVGDTTGGGGGAGSNRYTETISLYTLPSGIQINIPTGYFLKYDGSHYEWLGVPPDIYIEQTEEDIKNGRDKQLDYAISILQLNCCY